MIDETTKLLARDIDLTALAQRYGVMLHKHGANEFKGACPCPGCTADRDGFHVNTELNRWRCYTCHNGAWYDAVELVKVCEGLSYPDAVQWLLGESTSTPRITKRVAPVQQPVKSWDSVKAMDFLAKAQDRLWAADGMGDRARGYLEGRGLDSATWLNFGLGVANVKAGNGNYAPAIVIPWFIGDGQLVSLAHRFLESQDGQRYSRWGSSVNRLFGNHANLDAADTLVITEGEFNAMAVWQVAHHTGVHVLSTGKQVNRLPDSAVKIITERYSTIIVWADEQTISDGLRQQIRDQGNGVAVATLFSAIPFGDKQDANTELQNGQLGLLIGRCRTDTLEQSPERMNKLLANLLHGAESLQGLDGGSAKILQSMARRLGKPLQLEQVDPDRWLVYADGLPPV